MIVDLHCHSNYSDGELSPEELVKRAVDANVDVLALTDHDTIDGLADLNIAAQNKNISVVNGIELSLCWKKYVIHVLGLNIDLNSESLKNIIKLQKENRILRAQRISELLAKCGIKDAFAKASKIALYNNIGRPHFAQILKDEGIVANIQEAFRLYLGKNKKAYVKTSWIDLSDGVQAIINAGGIASVAHPLKYKLTRTKLYELISEFKLFGGEAIEVVSSDERIYDAELLADVSREFNLFASTGSDFHADNVSRTAIGKQRELPKNCTPIWHKWSLNK